MKTIICFSLFLLATSDDDRSFETQLFPPTRSEMEMYMKCTMGGIPIFSKTMEIFFRKIRHLFYTTKRVRYQTSELLAFESSMNEIFLGTIFYNIKDYLNVYYEIAEELIKRRKHERLNNDFVNSIKLEKDLDDFCVVSVLYNRKIYDVKPMFRCIFYLQTFMYGPNRMEPESILSDMHKMRSDFNFYYDLDNMSQKEDAPVTDTYRDRYLETPDAELFEELNSERKEFKTMSKMFCSSTSAEPFIKRSLLFEERVNNDHKDGYYDFVMLKEQCVININMEPPNVYNSSKRVISEWNCRNILTNPSYEFENYLRDLKLMPNEWLEYGKYLENEKQSNVEVIMDMSETKIYSLWSLRKKLKEQYHYINFFQYKTIEAHVLMFSAMKEGKKYFKAINHFFDVRCKEDNFNISDDEFLFMKNRLFLFQLYYDKLHDEIFEKLHVNFDNDEQTHFKNTVKDVLHYLDFPKNLDGNERKNWIRNACIEMKRTVGFHNIDYHGGYELINLIFADYYYNDPILHTYALINFIES